MNASHNTIVDAPGTSLMVISMEWHVNEISCDCFCAQHKRRAEVLREKGSPSFHLHRFSRYCTAVCINTVKWCASALRKSWSPFPRLMSSTTSERLDKMKALEIKKISLWSSRKSEVCILWKRSIQALRLELEESYGSLTNRRDRPTVSNNAKRPR